MKNSVKPVQLDLRRMVDTHEKLSKGESVDQQTVSTLLLAGVINITSQHDAIAELEDRIKALEHSDITQRSRIESVENWILIQNDTIANLVEKISSNDNGQAKESEIEALKEIIRILEDDT